MKDEQASALTCALRLLFDGKEPLEIAGAVHDALGDKSWTVTWHLVNAEPIAILACEDTEGVGIFLENKDKTFVGTDEDMHTLLKEMEDKDLGDYTYDVIYNARSEALDALMGEHPSWFADVTPEVTP